MIRFLSTCVFLTATLYLVSVPTSSNADIAGVFAARAQTNEKPPPDVEMLLPRGGIPAIFEPEFVPAEEADVPDDAWVLGVVLNGEARAYSLNLLNAHEIVNDYYRDLAAAAVW